ncbi:EscE/YscE/SsaE family type III secretion system needle protein co-chaperone [Pandoraea anhela]|uniref:EscE/YscE/SsaE family type III secretion system needle protein co-chaperone n=1 Tax=Pandoraea anhela TaxID=2508295 RepID=A0A5E4YIF4_9BURK|nr:EscE/YscE/SsaE family type III secretion system needle protein co-chaperone [Pandoraea anhela]VVE48501.1 EscE/YscE/SsaE family type III secretion system needle protein co-chaperone [Pandoraea anhela]
MTIHLTRIEDALAASPHAISRDVGAQLDAASKTLDTALRAPLTPAQHAQALAQKQAVCAAGAILESITRRYSTSYGKAP